MRGESKRWLVAAVAALGALAWSPGQARACGGMFCDSGPQAMPVDQKGENILYVVDQEAGTVEAHIQIQYEGEAARFAWVLPVQATPILTVGSQPLFDAMLAGSVPTYGYATQRDSCGNQGFGSPSAGNATGGGAGGASAGGENGGPSVVYKTTVGAFEAVVLDGGTAEGVMKWLGDNGYQQTPAAEPILKQYLDQNYLFVAIKLKGGAGVDEIHPLVVTYHGTQPCVPIRLTAVAAKDNMGIRTLFLDKGRWVPTNYKHVELNPVQLTWQNFAPNYLDVVTRAVDSDVAMGHAFVTEYAGPSNVVPQGSFYSTAWSAKPFEAYQPVYVVDELTKQGLMQCGVFVNPNGPGGPGGAPSKGCRYNHPLLRSLLDEYLPAPVDMPADTFYECLSCYSDQIDQTKWDGAAFAAKMEERIVGPGKHASELLQKWPYLTRLFTTISPAEMTADPEFHPRHDLPAVQRVRQGNRRILCTNRSGIELPDERDVALDVMGQWPVWTDEMPWAEKIQEIPKEGAPIDLKVNTPKIDELLAAWNRSQGWPPPPLDGSAGPSGAGGGAAAPADEVGGGGCSAGGGRSGAGWLLLLAAAGLVRGRRRG